MAPHSVMLGFVNGLAIVIFLAQFNHFKVDGARMQSGQWLLMGALIAITTAIIHLLPKLTSALPSALAAILIVSGILAGMGIETKTVGPGRGQCHCRLFLHHGSKHDQH